MAKDMTALVNAGEGALTWGKRVGIVLTNENLNDLSGPDKVALMELWREHGGQSKQ